MMDILPLLGGIMGAVIGFGGGVLGAMFVFDKFSEPLQANPPLAAIGRCSLPGLGMVAGGWLALSISGKRDKAQRDKARVERKKLGAKRRKKK